MTDPIDLAKAWSERSREKPFDFGLIEKVSHVVPFSSGLLNDIVNPTPPTAEQREQYRLRREQEAAEHAARLASHERLMAATTGPLRAVLALHAPVPVQNTFGHPRHVCEGCDMDGYEAESPEWPCRTWCIAAEDNG